MRLIVTQNGNRKILGHDDVFFSTYVMLEPDNLCVCVCVCVCVCPLQALGHSREGINGQIGLKFGTLIVWVNHWGCFFSFFESLIFGPWRVGPGPYME